MLLVLFQPSTIANTYLALGGHHLQLLLVVLFQRQLAHLWMCINTCWCSLQLVLCGGGVYICIYVYMCVCLGVRGGWCYTVYTCRWTYVVVHARTCSCVQSVAALVSCMCMCEKCGGAGVCAGRVIVGYPLAVTLVI